MWVLWIGVLVLTWSGVGAARQWLYGLYREDPARQLGALQLHGGLTVLLMLHALAFQIPGTSLALLAMAILSMVLGLLLVKRDPPQELAEVHVPSSVLLKR